MMKRVITAIILACTFCSFRQLGFFDVRDGVKKDTSVRMVENTYVECSEICECEEEEEQKEPCLKQHPLVEVKAGYFFFTDSHMRHVYDQGGVDIQLSGSYPIYKILHVYGSVEYLQKSGHSIHGHQKTSIWAVPLSLGLR